MPGSIDWMSYASQMYLAEIYRLGQGRTWVNTGSLAERLRVSGPAVVRMAHRLYQEGLIEHQRYQGVFLTMSGTEAALLSIRRHRLLERLLVDVLHIGWHEVHAQAVNFQKGVNQPFEDRLESLLGSPGICPHGEPIPTRDGTVPELADRPLVVVPARTRGRISRVRTRDPDKLQYLARLGCFPGTAFELVHRAPFNGPLWLRIGQNEQMIGTELAATLWLICTPKEEE